MRATAITPAKKTALSKTAVYLTKRRRLFAPATGGDCPLRVVASAAQNLESLGFTFSQELFQCLLRCSQTQVVELYREVFPVLAKMSGAHQSFRPMYPNFPMQVMAASQVELYVNAMAHYWGSFVSDVTGNPNLQLLPDYVAEPRAPLAGRAALRPIGIGNESDFETIFTQLLSSNGSLSASDKEIVGWFVQNYRGDYLRLLPPAIPQKENVAVLVGAAMKQKCADPLGGYLKTATDVLRAAAATSDGDVSLADATHFRPFARQERRFLLEALEGCASLTEDMLRWKERWKRLGERLHPGEYALRFPRTARAFQVLRDDEPFATFHGQVERLLQKAEWRPAVDLLATRPGLLARRLDHLLRLGAGDVALDRFTEVAVSVATPVLLQIHAHFKHRHNNLGPRTFFPKGEVAKMHICERPLPPLPADLTAQVTEIVETALVDRFRHRSPLGRVWIDPRLADFTVPFSQRSASKSLKTVSRGSRLEMPVADAYRLFLWWKDGRSRTDIDLSAAFFGVEFDLIGFVTYYNLREYGCCHSGDITSAPEGACEFIDVDVRTLRQKGVRYVALILNSFTQQPYCDLPECFAGWMARMKPQSGEIFEARTVRDKVDLAADTTVCVPVVFDLDERKAIWCDLALKSSAAINNLHTNRTNLAQMVLAISSLRKPTLFDLFSLHARARGTITPREEAESVFSIHEGVATPFDIDTILSEYLA